MNKTLRILLELQELELVRKSRLLAREASDESELEDLDGKIGRLRRQIPGAVLSEYDRLCRLYADALTTLDGVSCQGCQQAVTHRSIRAAERSPKPLQCDHCGRFLVTQETQPDYIGID